MALQKFASAIMAEEPINLFNYGKHRRDFTYIDDIVEGIIRVLDRPPQPNLDWSSDDPDPATSKAPWKIYNIGNNQPVELMYYIELLEENLEKKTKKNLLPLQPGDVPDTYADVDDLMRDVGFKPKITVEQGIAKFAEWFKEYYKFQ
jgi:UDP-glucuronate 4-epimerase